MLVRPDQSPEAGGLPHPARRDKRGIENPGRLVYRLGGYCKRLWRRCGGSWRSRQGADLFTTASAKQGSTEGARASRARNQVDGGSFWGDGCWGQSDGRGRRVKKKKASSLPFGPPEISTLKSDLV